MISMTLVGVANKYQVAFPLVRQTVSCCTASIPFILTGDGDDILHPAAAAAAAFEALKKRVSKPPWFAIAWVSFRFVNAIKMGGNPRNGPPKPLPPKSIPDFDINPTPGGTIQTLELPPPRVHEEVE